MLRSPVPLVRPRTSTLRLTPGRDRDRGVFASSTIARYVPNHESAAVGACLSRATRRCRENDKAAMSSRACDKALPNARAKVYVSIANMRAVLAGTSTTNPPACTSMREGSRA